MLFSLYLPLVPEFAARLQASKLATNNLIAEKRLIQLSDHLGDNVYNVYTTIAARTVIERAVNDGLLDFQGCILYNPGARIRPIVH